MITYLPAGEELFTQHADYVDPSDYPDGQFFAVFEPCAREAEGFFICGDHGCDVIPPDDPHLLDTERGDHSVAFYCVHCEHFEARLP